MDSDSEVVAIHICERCEAPLIGKYPSQRHANNIAVCGSCGLAPVTRVHGAVEPVYAVHQGAYEAGCRRQIIECYRIRDTDEWDLFIRMNISQDAPDDADVRDEPAVAIGDELAAIKHPARVSYNLNYAGGEEWDAQIEVRVRYPPTDPDEETFWEFLESEPDREEVE